MSNRNNKKSKSYSNKEKLEHYSKRVNDKTLTSGQRDYAKQRVEELISQKSIILSQAQQKLTGAHLAKIKDGYLFKSDKVDKEHTYVVYLDSKTNEIRAVPTTHLYLPDMDKMEELKRNHLRKVKFAGYETPSGVENYYYVTDVNGNLIDLSHTGIKIDKTPLPTKQAQVIINFAKNKR